MNQLSRKDPYGWTASKLLGTYGAAITAFWQVFAKNADLLDHGFESQNPSVMEDSVSVMAELANVSDQLAWEFGPSNRGHMLIITAEFHDELRPLALLVLAMAPDLPRWRFETECPGGTDGVSQLFESRFQSRLAIHDMDFTAGKTGKVDLVVTGRGDADLLAGQALQFATLVLGEKQERDWIGAIDANPTTGGWFPLRRKLPTIAPRDFAASFETVKNDLIAALPELPYSATLPEDRSVLVAQRDPSDEDYPRADSMTLSFSSEALGFALMAPRFASPNHSRFGEWFVELRIPRLPEHPFDQVDDRYAIEDALHAVLTAAGVGGYAASSHGTRSVYIDVALTDVARGFEAIMEYARDMPWFQEASLRFHDVGMSENRIPLSQAGDRPQ